MKDWLINLWPILFWLFIGVPLVILGSRLAGRGLQRIGREHAGMIVARLIMYIGLVAILASVLITLDVDLTGWLATAGVVTIAIGFAAQTSLSNYISGLFLMGEHTFRVGDLIRAGGTTGVVESIDLLSVKLRTLDNTFVRLPNEEMLKSQVVTVTRYPIRRMDVKIRVAFEAPLPQVHEILRAVAANNPFCLVEPEPLILTDELGENGFELRLGVWFERTKYVETRNSLFADLQARFLEAGIRFQLPRMLVEDFPSKASKSEEKTD